MESTNGNMRTLFFYILPVSIILSGCLINPKLSEWAENNLHKGDTYIFDADTILQTIANGEVSQDTFRLYSAALDDDAPLRYQYWNQDEHLALATGFHQWYLNGSTENWSLLKVEFDSTCEDIHELSSDPSAPLNWLQASVFYYKTGINVEYKIPNRQVHWIILSPDFGSMSIGEYLHNPNPFVPNVEIPDLGSLDSSEMKIKVAAAYRIAEEAGGGKYDHCSISAKNSLEDEYDGWFIHYFVNKYEFFTVVVNDQTGEYEILDE